MKTGENEAEKIKEETVKEWVRQRYNLDSWKFKDAIEDARLRYDVISMRDLAIQKTIEKVEGLIEKLPRFKANSWEDFDGEHLEHEEDSYGDWVRWSDLNSQLESFKKELKK